MPEFVIIPERKAVRLAAALVATAAILTGTPIKRKPGRKPGKRRGRKAKAKGEAVPASLAAK